MFEVFFILLLLLKEKNDGHGNGDQRGDGGKNGYHNINPVGFLQLGHPLCFSSGRSGPCAFYSFILPFSSALVNPAASFKKLRENFECLMTII